MKKIPISEYYENEAKEHGDFLINNEVFAYMDNKAITYIRKAFTIELEDWSDNAISAFLVDISGIFWWMNVYQIVDKFSEEFLDTATFCALFNCKVIGYLDYSNICGYNNKSIVGIYRAFNDGLSLDKYEKLNKKLNENVPHLIDKLMSYFNVATITELAQKLDMSQPEVINWLRINPVNAIKIKCRELGIYNEIFEDLNSKKFSAVKKGWGVDYGRN